MPQLLQEATFKVASFLLVKEIIGKGGMMPTSFEMVSFAPAKKNIVNYKTVYQVDSKLLVEGKSAKIKFVTKSDWIYVSTEPIDPYVTDLSKFICLTDLPEGLYLAPGEKLYAFNFDTKNSFTVKMVHYLDQPPGFKFSS